jgi:hypothetical protein
VTCKETLNVLRIDDDIYGGIHRKSVNGIEYNNLSFLSKWFISSGGGSGFMRSGTDVLILLQQLERLPDDRKRK